MGDSTTSVKAGPQLSFWDKFEIFKENRYVTVLLPMAMLLLVVGIFGPLTGWDFFSKGVITGIFNQGLIVAVLATGVSFIYSTGNLDISIGSVMALTATVGATVYNATQSVVLMTVTCALLGVVLMLFNCTMSVVFNIKTITVAIVMMQIYNAIIAKILGAADLKVDYAMCIQLENGGFRYIAFILYFVVALLIYHFTKVGRAVRFVGGNPNCAAQTGISAKSYTVISFLVTGLGVGIAALFTIIRAGSISINTGTGMGMDVMLATVLGGMSIFGGAKSNSYSGLIGALTVVALNKGLLMVGIPNTIIQGIRGILFLLLVYINSERQSTLPTRQQV